MLQKIFISNKCCCAFYL